MSKDTEARIEQYVAAYLALDADVTALRRSAPPGMCLDMHPTARTFVARFLHRYWTLIEGKENYA